MPTEENIVAGLENTIAYLKTKEFSAEQDNLTLQPVLDAKDYIEKRKQNKGHWHITEHEYLNCSICGGSYYTGCESTKEAERNLASGKAYPFCPHCGSEMIVPNKEEEY